jgi:asparagine synthetase B (glutamine-hydrolysing)
MCGIAGIFLKRIHSLLEDIHQMVDRWTIGPDGREQPDTMGAIGFRRLAIIDLSHEGPAHDACFGNYSWLSMEKYIIIKTLKGVALQGIPF